MPVPSAWKFFRGFRGKGRFLFGLVRKSKKVKHRRHWGDIGIQEKFFQFLLDISTGIW
jgi:hypothetical protein